MLAFAILISTIHSSHNDHHIPRSTIEVKTTRLGDDISSSGYGRLWMYGEFYETFRRLYGMYFIIVL
jgi:hypothetical protein